MVDPKAKITTVTEAGERIIREHLDEPAVALFIAASFLEVRLRTVLRSYFRTVKHRNADALLEDMSLMPLIRLSYAQNILDKTKHDDFVDLAKKRGKLGHDTTEWRLRDKNDDRLYRRLSESTLEFIVEVGSHQNIRERLLSIPPDAPPEEDEEE